MELAREISVSSPSAVAQAAQQSMGEFTVARAISAGNRLCSVFSGRGGPSEGLRRANALNCAKAVGLNCWRQCELRRTLRPCRGWWSRCFKLLQKLSS